MKNTVLLEEIINKRSEEISHIVASYPNGGMVKGPVSRIRYKPLRITLQKEESESKRAGTHKLVLDHVVEIIIHFNSGESQTII